MSRLAIVTTHPIQYYAPVFRLLHERRKITIKIFYTWGRESLDKFDPGFNKNIKWDISLVDNYPFEWIINTSDQPGSHHFRGIINPDLISRLKQFNPDAILFVGWAYQSHLRAIRYFKNKVPLYFRGDSTLIDERKGIKAQLRFGFLKWVYQHIDYAFYNGINNRAYFKKFGLKDEQLIFAPHAVDNDRFSILRCEEVKTLKSVFNLNVNDILVLYAGKFEEKKDPLLLVEAFLELGHNDCHLLLVGNGPLEHTIKKKAQNKKNIHFMDFQNQSYMPVIFQACDLFCLPSKGPGESWGLAVNEAMACEKAVLVSDRVGCAADLVRQNFNGNIFESNNKASLLLHLERMTRSKSTLSAFGKNSGIIIKDWNFTKIVTAIENTLLNETD